jgi:hypothetical protein
VRGGLGAAAAARNDCCGDSGKWPRRQETAQAAAAAAAAMRKRPRRPGTACDSGAHRAAAWLLSHPAATKGKGGQERRLKSISSNASISICNRKMQNQPPLYRLQQYPQPVLHFPLPPLRCCILGVSLPVLHSNCLLLPSPRAAQLSVLFPRPAPAKQQGQVSTARRAATRDPPRPASLHGVEADTRRTSSPAGSRAAASHLRLLPRRTRRHPSVPGARRAPGSPRPSAADPRCRRVNTPPPQIPDAKRLQRPSRRRRRAPRGPLPDLHRDLELVAVPRIPARRRASRLNTGPPLASVPRSSGRSHQSSGDLWVLEASRSRRRCPLVVAQGIKRGVGEAGRRPRTPRAQLVGVEQLHEPPPGSFFHLPRSPPRRSWKVARRWRRDPGWRGSQRPQPDAHRDAFTAGNHSFLREGFLLSLFFM